MRNRFRRSFRNSCLAILAILFSAIILVGIICRVPARLLSPKQPEETVETLFRGITYEREVRNSPRPMVIHIITVDLSAQGIGVLVTPGDLESSRPLEARTTSEYLQEFGLQLAVNGDAFSPWIDLGFIYYPFSGNNVDVYGLAASNGEIYSEATQNQPTLYISRATLASIDPQPSRNRIHNAISGTNLLIRNGAMRIEGLPHDVQPRTAIAINQSGTRLIIVVVDGRQPGYSEGASMLELAQILLDHRGYTGFNLDGGGSSTLVIQGENGEPQVLNSPIHQRIPGKQRPIGNHLGIFAREE
ncbi:MAG: phosphodiester glycosidase family protein [Chloroflexi bacterium]|nr:phosphodiester glycosidase family protein [Chloroflexota bacterium]